MNNKYNIGTLLDRNIVEHINGVINGTQKWVTELMFENDNYSGFVKTGNVCHGYGKYVWKNGNFYEGSFRDGKRHGYGKYVYANGAIYEHNYRNGKLLCEDGQTYEGILKFEMKRAQSRDIKYDFVRKPKNQKLILVTIKQMNGTVM